MKRQRATGANVNNINNSNGAVVAVSSMITPKVEDMAVGAATAMGKKRSKKEGEQSKVVVVAAEEDEERNMVAKEVIVGGGGVLQQGAGDNHHHHNHNHHQYHNNNNNNNNQSVMMGWNWEEYMPWLGGVDDEQMSWGSTWFPGWDIDFMGDAEAFSALYSDVVWDDDIWNLRKEIPIPLDSNTIHLG